MFSPRRTRSRIKGSRPPQCRRLSAVFQSGVELEPPADPLNKIRLRRSPDEQDDDANHAEHKANRVEPLSGQGVTHSILPPAAAASLMERGGRRPLFSFARHQCSCSKAAPGADSVNARVILIQPPRCKSVGPALNG